MLTRSEAGLYRILVVDDDPMMLELICTRLTLAGFQTVHARDGYEGLDRLRDAKADALLLDINMPRLDGFGVLRQMKTLGHLPRMPVMVLTARNQTSDVQEAIQLGARDFLTKPFDDQRLLTRVARLVRPASAARPALPARAVPAAKPTTRLI
jgi:DNA-binding response OmpR family regulator